MIKILPSHLEGDFYPASSNESLIPTLALAAFSDKPCRVLYKSLSDDAMCTVFILERMGASFRISEREISVEPVKQRTFDYLYANFRNSEASLIYLLPILKSVVEVLDADCSEKLALENMSRLLTPLAGCGCKLRGKRLPMTIKGKISKEIALNHHELADAFLTGLIFNRQKMNKCDPSKSAIARLERFGIEIKDGENLEVSGAVTSPDLTETESDPFYLSLFAAASTALKTPSPLPDKMLPFINCERKGKSYLLTPRIAPIKADFSELGEFFYPTLILALRAGGESVFENYSSDTNFHNRLIQLFDDLKVEHSIKQGKLTVLSNGKIAGEKVREWSDERFTMTACMASLISQSGTVIDSEKHILSRFPDFFDDLEKLGGKIQNL